MRSEVECWMEVDSGRWAISVVGSADDVDAHLLGAVNSTSVSYGCERWLECTYKYV